MLTMSLSKIASRKNLFALLLLTAFSCAKRELKPLTPCVQSTVSKSVPPKVDKVDLLFAIDGSGSMVEENKLLADQLPRLVQALTTGKRNPNSNIQDFTPVSDLHVGMVTIDMGVNGAEWTGGWKGDPPECIVKVPANRPYSRFIAEASQNINLGNDGILWNIVNPNATYGNGTSCAGITLPPYDRFLSFKSSSGPTATEIANQFSCMSQLLSASDVPGTVGHSQRLSCGFEQQLEAILKATYPADDSQVLSGNRITFFQGTKGHADYNATGLTSSTDFRTPEPPPLNSGFFRKDALLAVVLVSDEDDCSTARNIPYDDNGKDENGEPIGPLFSGSVSIPEKSSRPLSFQEVLCTRAADKLEKDPASGLLHSLERYVNGFLAAKDPSLFLFSAIVGIPTEADARAYFTDTSKQDLSSILSHPKMQYVETGVGCDANCGTAGQTDRVVRGSACGSESSLAYPGRRYVKLAQKLKEKKSSAVVWPICEESFAPAIDALILEISKIIDAACLPRPKDLEADGTVKCDVIETQAVGTKCVDVPGRELLRTEEGREVCRVNQVSLDKNANPLPSCDVTTGANCGWFYDDFTVASQIKPGSLSVTEACKPTPTRDGSQRLAFTNRSESLEGSSIRFECFEAAQSVPGEGVSAKIGVSCRTDTSVCGSDLICESTSKTCQKGCSSDAECPGGYVCDKSFAQPYCLNPICG